MCRSASLECPRSATQIRAGSSAVTTIATSLRQSCRSNRPKQEIKRTQYLVNLKVQHTVRWLLIENKDSHKVLTLHGVKHVHHHCVMHPLSATVIICRPVGGPSLS